MILIVTAISEAGLFIRNCQHRCCWGISHQLCAHIQSADTQTLTQTHTRTVLLVPPVTFKKQTSCWFDSSKEALSKHWRGKTQSAAASRILLHRSKQHWQLLTNAFPRWQYEAFICTSHTEFCALTKTTSVRTLSELCCVEVHLLCRCWSLPALQVSVSGRLDRTPADCWWNPPPLCWTFSQRRRHPFPRAA